MQFKQQSRLEEKRKKALDLQLDFIVGQTEKYSDLLTQSLNETLPVPSKTSGSHAGSTASSPPPPAQLMEDEGQFPQLCSLSLPIPDPLSMASISNHTFPLKDICFVRNGICFPGMGCGISMTIPYPPNLELDL